MKPQDDSKLSQAKILFVDDEPPILKALERALARTGSEVLLASSGIEALEIMSQEPVDIVVSDMRMPQMSGDEFLEKVSNQYPETIRMVLTGYADMDSVLHAVNKGRIWGYMKKPWSNEELIISLEQAMFAQRILAEYSLLRRTLDQYERFKRAEFEGFIGESVSMSFVYREIEQCAASNASVFITGPTGSGKEVAASAIHKLSLRKDKPFIALNCAAIPNELMESEIFGHIKGAFSGAVSNRAGAAENANGGTLFFDEIGEMDMGLQAKLLRFIQTGTYQKVGSDKTEQVDIRFICATNRDPLEAIAEKKLREDLYYRLNVISISLPALVQRGGDAMLIAHSCLESYSIKENKIFIGISSEAENLICSYSWPGNVRQLINAVYGAVVMSEGPLLSADALGRALKLDQEEISKLSKSKTRVANTPEPTPQIGREDLSPESSLDSPNQQVIQPLAVVERYAIERAIDFCDGNVVKAATALEVSPSTLYRKVQSWQS